MVHKICILCTSEKKTLNRQYITIPSVNFRRHWKTVILKNLLKSIKITSRSRLLVTRSYSSHVGPQTVHSFYPVYFWTTLLNLTIEPVLSLIFFSKLNRDDMIRLDLFYHLQYLYVHSLFIFGTLSVLIL